MQDTAWTADLPDAPGYYWWRDSPVAADAQLVLLRRGQVVVQGATYIRSPLDPEAPLRRLFDSPAALGGIWAGPITPPEPARGYPWR